MTHLFPILPRLRLRITVNSRVICECDTLSCNAIEISLCLLASERSERDTIRDVQNRAGAVRMYIFISE